MKIKQLAVRDPEMVEKLIDVWTRSVRATHTFLNEDDIRRLTPVVRQGLTEIPVLVTVETDEGNPVGFMGIGDGCLEMLFLHPDCRGQGLGRQLLKMGIEQYDVRRLDVNEQNPAAHGFYEHMGFKVVGRSEFDDYGNPFPILHLILETGIRTGKE